MGEALNLNWVTKRCFETRGPRGRKNLCAVNCASFISRRSSRKDGQSRGAAIEFGDRLLQDLEAVAVKWENGSMSDGKLGEQLSCSMQRRRKEEKC